MIENLRPIFATFAQYGRPVGCEGGDRMDNRNFVKLCRDATLFDEAFVSQDADLIFAKVKDKGQRKISFEQFKMAIHHIAFRKGVPTEKVVECVLVHDQPKADRSALLKRSSSSSRTLDRYGSSTRMLTHSETTTLASGRFAGPGARSMSDGFGGSVSRGARRLSSANQGSASPRRWTHSSFNPNVFNKMTAPSPSQSTMPSPMPSPRSPRLPLTSPRGSRGSPGYLSARHLNSVAALPSVHETRPTKPANQFSDAGPTSFAGVKGALR